MSDADDQDLFVDAVALRILLDGEQRVVREHVRAVLAQPRFQKPSEPLSPEDYREKVTEWTAALAETGGLVSDDPMCPARSLSPN